MIMNIQLFLFSTLYYTLTQDLEKYVREGRKEDCVRVMRGMRKWQWRGLEEGLRAMGILLDGM